MPEERLTPAQLRTLEEIEATRVRWDSQSPRFYSTVWPPAVRHDVVERVVELGFAEIADKAVGKEISPRVLLTDKGREALAQHRSQS